MEEQYNYNNIKTWKFAIEGDIFMLRKLHIPVNIKNQHWILVSIDMTLREIQIYDSKGQHYIDVQKKYREILD